MLAVISFDDLNEDRWDQLCLNQGGCSLDHLHYFIRYQSLSFNVANKSFVLIDRSKDSVISICPLFVEECEVLPGIKIPSLSVGGEPLPNPLMRAYVSPSQRRRDLKSVFKIIDEVAMQCGVKRILFKKNSTDVACGTAVSSDLFELLKLGFNPICFNSLIMDLEKDEESIFSAVSKTHQKIIKRAKQMGQVVQIIDHLCSKENIASEFKEYQNAHFKAAGRQTRPQASFDFMRELIENGRAALFINNFEGEEISHLYCDMYGKAARGWSQANNKEAEKNVSPRHLTEWEAMLYFKRKGAKFYVLGTQFSKGQPETPADDKLIGISDFKERYGAQIWPSVYFEKYYDKADLKLMYTNRVSHIEDGRDG
jgi:hypothetical protein